MSKRESVAWECPNCGHRHLLKWPRWDIQTFSHIGMHCEGCKSQAWVRLIQIGRKAWAAAFVGSK